MQKRAALFHNRYRQQARRYLNKCRRIQRALADGELIRLDWAGPVLEREGWRKEFRSFWTNALISRRVLPVTGESFRQCIKRGSCAIPAPTSAALGTAHRRPLV